MLAYFSEQFSCVAFGKVTLIGLFQVKLAYTGYMVRVGDFLG